MLFSMMLKYFNSMPRTTNSWKTDAQIQLLALPRTQSWYYRAQLNNCWTILACLNLKLETNGARNLLH